MEIEISCASYRNYVQQWGDKTYKIELNRDFHDNDGDDVACNWDLIPEHSETYTTVKTYENRVMASNSVFKADKVDSIDKKQFKLYEYPECKDAQQAIVLGRQASFAEEKYLRYINGYYGSKKQFKLFVCVWDDMSETAAERQHSYWENLNKNEFLVCLGTNKSNEIKWVKCYSWMDRPTLGVATEQYFRDNRKLDILKFAKWLPKQIETLWSRKRFRDFKYLKVEITYSQYTAMFIVVVLLSLIQAFIIYKTLKKTDR